MGKFRKFWSRVKTAVKIGVHRFVVWFNLHVKSDLLDFLDDNKDLAMRIVLDVARELAGHPGKVKFNEAFKRLADHLAREVESGTVNVTRHTSWINLLIEIAVQVLKAQGRL